MLTPTPQDSKAPVRKLGRGLGALLAAPEPVRINIPNEAPKIVPQPSVQTTNREVFDSNQIGLRTIAIGLIEPSPFQPRKSMDQPAIERLADSIRRSGVMQPIIVRQKSSGGGERFELVAGERRWRAAQLAGLLEVPALVRDLTDELAAEWSLVENVQREDLNAMERAWALRGLSERFQLTQVELAQRVGLERSTVANLIRLTELEPEIAQMIVRGDLTAGHGRALLAIPAGEARLNLAREAVQNGWNTRRVEYLSQAHAVKPENVGSKRTTPQEITARQAVLRDLERQIGQKLGTKVLITTDRTGARGKLSMEFYSIDHFDGLLARLGIPTR